jgi:hypothetical protein
MKTSFLAYLIILLLPIYFYGCKHEKTNQSFDAFLGEWYTIKGDVEAYSFLKDDSSYIFVGTQGMRPVVYGTWKINKDKFIITMDNGTTTEYSFTHFNDTLNFNNGEEIYTRTTPLDVKYPEIKILTALSSDMGDLTFSGPQNADLKWGYLIDSTQKMQEFSIHGFSIIAESTLSSGKLKEISDYLKDYGFESDTLFMTEICDGYWDNNQVVTICTQRDNEADNDSIDIIIASGLVVN